MTIPSAQKKLIPWDRVSKSNLEVRVYCPKCGKSKVIEGYVNSFWQTANIGMKVTQCDACRAFIEYRVLRDGVEV